MQSSERVGQPDVAVKKSIDLVPATLINSGLAYPRGHLSMNLGPADLAEGNHGYGLRALAFACTTR